MRYIMTVFTVLIAFIFFVDSASAQAGKISAGLSISYGGFSLKGNSNGTELMGVGRDANKTASTSIGMGLLLSYGILNNLDATYDYSYEYCNEVLVEAYSQIMHDFGLRYYITGGGFRPFVKASYTKYVVENLKLIDPEVNSIVKTREYDFSGSGLSYGIGIDISAGERLSYILGYYKTATFSFKKTEGSVDFENKPSSSRFSFAFRIKF